MDYISKGIFIYLTLLNYFVFISPYIIIPPSSTCFRVSFFRHYNILLKILTKCKHYNNYVRGIYFRHIIIFKIALLIIYIV